MLQDYDTLIVLLSAIKRSAMLIAVMLGGIFFLKNKPIRLIVYLVFYSMCY